MAIRDPKQNMPQPDYLCAIGLTQEQIDAIAAHYDKEAEQYKTKTINMRVSPHILSEIKAAAEANGYAKYQQWINKVLHEAIAMTFPERYSEAS